jgi:hypothetical protein
LVVWTILKNISQLGWLFQIYEKMKMFQTTNQWFRRTSWFRKNMKVRCSSSGDIHGYGSPALKKIRYGYLALSVADQDALRKMSTQD